MNRFISLGFPLAMLIVFTLSSYSLQDDPNGKAGASGAPGETTCNTTSCHNSYTLNSGTGSITITSPDLVNWAYVPGTTYTISVTVAQTGINLFGVCFEALKPNGDNAGLLHAGVGTQIKTKTVSGFQRKSITHNTNTGATAASHTFTFTWDAPTTDIGAITFYVAGLAANGNTTEVGDRVYSTSQVVTSTSLNLNELVNSRLEKNVYPNPANDVLHASVADFAQTPDQVNILNLQGATIATRSATEWKSENNLITLPIQDLPAGTYNLIFTHKGRAVGFSKFQRIGH
ncbi:MAG: hypothetical protein RL040_671 [Bacteroidota bacterium]|jgi:hypothetical protein